MAMPASSLRWEFTIELSLLRPYPGRLELAARLALILCADDAGCRNLSDA
jgi:hypothetical protein